MKAFDALRTGWKRSRVCWQPLLVLFLVNLLGGMLLAAIPALELIGPAHYTAIRDAASGVPTWLATELLFNPVGNLNLQGGENARQLSAMLQSGLLALLLAVGLLPGLAWIPGSLVAGGLILSYLECPKPTAPSSAEDSALSGGAVNEPALSGGGGHFSWRRFFWGCWHHWGAFLIFGILQTLLTLLVFVPVLLISITVIVAAPVSAVVLVPLFLALLVLWSALVELAQVSLVAGGRRRIGGALRDGLRLLFRRLGSLSVYYLVSLLLLLVVHLVFRIGIFPRLPLAFWPLVLLLQQAFIFLRLWLHAGRMAGNVEFVRVDLHP